MERHYGPEPPRLALNLDELLAGHMKGMVLGFAHLRDLVQAQFDTMNDGLQCHVMSQIDNSSDHFPYLKKAFDAAHLWRWRFHGRHADADFHHEPIRGVLAVKGLGPDRPFMFYSCTRQIMTGAVRPLR